ncbi:MAG: hypothetical protein Q7T82_09370 [Armatimonadota bacterium]|nr:hypothetical protein [Armatimonadota bacterium]
METSLGWIALAVGALGAALAFVLAGYEKQADERRDGLIIALFTIVGAVIVFLLTRPVEEPFSPGQRLGWGALIGGLLGALAGLGSTRLITNTPWKSAIASVASCSLALLGTTVTLLIFKDYPQPALAGFVIGAVIAGALFRSALPASTDIEVWTLTTVALAATVTLGVFHYDNSPERFWWRAPLMTLAVVIIAQFAAASTAREGRKVAIPATLASVITLGLMAVMSWRLFPDWSVFMVALAGVITFALVGWLASTAASSIRASAVAAVAVVALSAFAFRQLGGFGVGIALLAGWAVVLPAAAASRSAGSKDEPSNPSRALVYAMFIGVGVLLLRLFLETYSPGLAGLDLRSHYTFVTLAIGVIFPFLLVSFFPILPDHGTAGRGVGAASAGLFAAAAPLVIALVWGMKPALGFVIGTVAAEVFVLFLCLGAISSNERRFMESATLALTAQVSAVLLSGLVLPLSEGTRFTRILVLAIALALAAIWAAISALLAHRPVREG